MFLQVLTRAGDDAPDGSFERSESEVCADKPQTYDHDDGDSGGTL